VGEAAYRLASRTASRGDKGRFASARALANKREGSVPSGAPGTTRSVFADRLSLRERVEFKIEVVLTDEEKEEADEANASDANPAHKLKAFVTVDVNDALEDVPDSSDAEAFSALRSASAYARSRNARSANSPSEKSQYAARNFLAQTGTSLIDESLITEAAFVFAIAVDFLESSLTDVCAGPSLIRLTTLAKVSASTETTSVSSRTLNKAPAVRGIRRSSAAHFFPALELPTIETVPAALNGDSMSRWLSKYAQLLIVDRSTFSPDEKGSVEKTSASEAGEVLIGALIATDDLASIVTAAPSPPTGSEKSFVNARASTNADSPSSLIREETTPGRKAP